MSLADARRLFDIAIRLQIYVEAVKVHQGLQFSLVLREVQEEFRKLLFRVNYKTLDALSKNELNKLVLRLRESQSTLYSKYLTKVLKQLQDFMQAALTVNRISYVSGFVEVEEDEDDFLPSDEQASAFIVAENKKNVPTAVYGIAAITKGSNALWSRVANEPIAANGVLVEGYVKAFVGHARVTAESQIMRAYANSFTPAQAVAEAEGQFKKLQNQGNAILSTSIQHVESVVGAAVQSALFGSYVWASVIDSGTTDICRKRNRKVYTYGSGPYPPAHVGCRSTTVPYRGGEPHTETLYTWIKRQKPAFQDFALGKQVAEAVRSGKAQAKDITHLDVSPMSVAEFKEIAPQVIA